MPPVVILIGTQRGGGQRRQQKASRQQHCKAQSVVAENRSGPGQAPGQNCGHPDAAQQQQQRRRGDAEPDQVVIRRYFGGKNPLAPEQLLHQIRMIDCQLKAGYQIVHRVGPSVGRYGVQSQPGGQDEQPGRQQDSFPFRPTPGVE